MDALQRGPLVRAAVLVEIPIGNAVDRRDDAGLRPKQWLHLIYHTGDGMRLQANDDKILRPKLGGICGAAWLNHASLASGPQVSSARLHPVGMRAAAEQSDACA